MVGDGKHEEGQSERGKKLKSKVVQVGQKISAKAALFRGHGKVAVLPDAEMPENYEKTEKQGIKTRLSKFLLDRDTLKDEGSIWGESTCLTSPINKRIADALHLCPPRPSLPGHV